MRAVAVRRPNGAARQPKRSTHCGQQATSHRSISPPKHASGKAGSSRPTNHTTSRRFASFSARSIVGGCGWPRPIARRSIPTPSSNTIQNLEKMRLGPLHSFLIPYHLARDYARCPVSRSDHRANRHPRAQTPQDPL